MQKHVLIVEDSPVMREMLILAFRSRPFVDIDQAGDGMAGIQALRAAPQPYDLILLDLNMPVMDGMKFLHFLATEPNAKGAVVAVVTTENSTQAEAQARSLGAQFYLRKPVTRRDVEAVLAAVIGDED